jgi:hypothetical protein
VGVAIKLTGSYPFGLWITAFAFAATAFYSFRLPKIVDTLRPDGVRTDPRPARPAPSGSSSERGGRTATVARRLGNWATRGFTAPVLLGMQGEATLRWLSGFLTLFLAFYIESVSHGWQAAANLGAFGVATGIGNFIGTGIGTRLKLARPDLIILFCNACAALACVVTALLFTLPVAIGAALVSAIANALAKLSLDAVIQRDVAEAFRSSAFGRSETFLQLAWVFGATVAILLPARSGQLGFAVASVVTVLVAVFMALRERAVRREGRRMLQERGGALASRRGRRDPHPGDVGTR